MMARPNLLFLLADDLRWDALGCMGNKIIQTPHLDRLAAEGTRFTNAFVTTSICVASRASCLTGQWVRRHGIEEFAQTFTPATWAQTYPALLRADGYRTGFVGKFGVGNAKAIAAMSDKFDFWRGLPGQGGETFFEKGLLHTTARLGNEALEFLSESDSRPFCLSVSFNAPHARDGKPREFAPDPRDEALYQDVAIPVPALAQDTAAFSRLPEAVQKSEGRTRWKWRFDTPAKLQSTVKDYYRLVSGIDREVGRLLAALPENTLVLFLSDNGWSLGERGLADKWFAYEEDIRVPLIAYGPGVKSGQVCDACALNVDIAPTLLAAAGVRVSRRMQGQSLLPLLAGEHPRRWRREFFYEHHSVAELIPPVEAIRSQRWKYIRWVGVGNVEELYDLQSDPLEEHNLATTAPQQLAALRARWQSEAHRLK